jgi:hypothetical protein
VLLAAEGVPLALLLLMVKSLVDTEGGGAFF